MRNNGGSGCAWLCWNPESPENTPKNAKKNNLLTTKGILKPKYKLSGVRFLHLACHRGRATRPYFPLSYGTGHGWTRFMWTAALSSVPTSWIYATSVVSTLIFFLCAAPWKSGDCSTTFTTAVSCHPGTFCVRLCWLVFLRMVLR